MKRIRFCTAIAMMFLCGTAYAQIPQLINYQGRVTTGGVNFDGSGQFKFALVDGGTDTTPQIRTATATASVVNGFVVGVSVTNGGAGYSSAPVVTVTGNGNGATATATVSGGVVTAITIGNPGAGYTGSASVVVAPPPPAVPTTAYVSYWSHDGTSAAGGEPTGHVTLPVSKGLYSLLLGDVSIAGMAAISATIGLVAGISSASSQTVVKSGYVAQLADVTGLVLTAPQSAVVEGTAIQVAAFEVLNDATTSPVHAESVSWSVQSGPLAGISTSGLAISGNVYQDTQATVAANHLGFQATLALTVLNMGTDDFGSYAGDGLPDAWQVQYFGIDNPLAAPHADASCTGQDNLFKWTSGLNPVDGSKFMVVATPLPGEPGKMGFSFSPLVSGRTYIVEYNDTLLSDGWHALTGYSQVDNGATRTITDNTAPGDHRFYRVVIGMP